ncbi:MAG: lysophospholipid acyltransferase family protein [Bacteroidota bacterium]
MKSPFVESLEYHGFAFLNRLARLLSFRMAGRVGSFLGAVGYYIIGYRKKITLDNLTQAFPELREKERRCIALRAYKSYGTVLVEGLWAGGQAEDVLVKTCRFVNPEIVQKHLNNPHGLILLSGHFGNWESLAGAFSLRLGRPIAIIAQHQRNKRIDAKLDVIRTRWKCRMIPMGIATREVFRELRDGKVVAMLGDQSGPKEAVFIDFFGRPAATHRGAAAFSLKSGAPIVMLFFVRRQDGVYETHFEEVDCTGIEEYTNENVIELTRRHTAILERYIRMHPDHWLWMHKRWKHTEYYQSTQPVEQEA